MRLAVLLLPLLAWSGASSSDGRWDEPAFDWWRRSVRRSLTILSVIVVLAVALNAVGR